MFGRIMKVGMFNQILFKEIVPLLPDCVLGMDTLTGEPFPYLVL